jgi:hypothetical protein
MSQVSDYNIANASGASVRSDLNAVFDAIKTLNSGGSDPSNTAPFMPYVDTADSNNLKIRNAANDGFVTVGSINSVNLGLLPRAGGTMTGQLLGDDGSLAGSPAYAFDNDTDTGMFRVGSNTIGFATAGVERVEISDSGLDMSNGLPIRFQDSSGAPFVALKSPTSVSANRTFTLPATTGTAGQFLAVSSSNHSATNAELEFSTVNGVPRGSVFCIAHTSIPSGYLECNGDALPNGTGTVQGITADFSALRALIGANLPDLRGEFVRGFDNGRGADSGRNMLSSQSASNAPHNHSISLSGTTSTKSLTGSVARIAETMAAFGTASGVFSKRSNVNTPTTPNATDSSPAGGFDMDASHNHTFSASGTSGNNGTEARPRNIAMMYIIKF